MINPSISSGPSHVRLGADVQMTVRQSRVKRCGLADVSCWSSSGETASLRLLVSSIPSNLTVFSSVIMTWCSAAKWTEKSDK